MSKNMWGFLVFNLGMAFIASLIMNPFEDWLFAVGIVLLTSFVAYAEVTA